MRRSKPFFTNPWTFLQAPDFKITTGFQIHYRKWTIWIRGITGGKNGIWMLMMQTLSWLARPKGLEPLTYWLEVSCSIQLSYGRCGKTRVYWTNSSYHQSQLYQASPYGCHILFSCNNHRVVSIQAFPICLYSCFRFSFSLKPKKRSFWSASL